MSIATVVTRGFGTFGTASEVVTRGYAIGAGPTPPTPTTGAGGQRRRRRAPAFLAMPETAPTIIVRGSMLAIEGADGFFATGNAYPSPEQIRARRNARILAMLNLV